MYHFFPLGIRLSRHLAHCFLLGVKLDEISTPWRPGLRTLLLLSPPHSHRQNQFTVQTPPPPPISLYKCLWSIIIMLLHCYDAPEKRFKRIWIEIHQIFEIIQRDKYRWLRAFYKGWCCNGYITALEWWVHRLLQVSAAAGTARTWAAIRRSFEVSSGPPIAFNISNDVKKRKRITPKTQSILFLRKVSRPMEENHLATLEEYKINQLLDDTQINNTRFWWMMV